MNRREMLAASVAIAACPKLSLVGLVEVDYLTDDYRSEACDIRYCDVCMGSLMDDVHHGPIRKFYRTLDEYESIVCERCVPAWRNEVATDQPGG